MSSYGCSTRIVDQGVVAGAQTNIRMRALDQARGLAVFMVFMWHGYFFLHVVSPPAWAPPAPLFFLSLLVHEGHSSVSLFLALSGYLFCLLLQGRDVSWRAFYWNRAIRLLPLLCVVFMAFAISTRMQGGSLKIYLHSLLAGLWLPTWPGGGWTLAVELHFYLLLPLLMWLLRRTPLVFLALLACAILLRISLWHDEADVQRLAHFTMVGRIDQFLLGMLAARYRHHLAGRHGLAAGVLVTFALFYWWLDREGGFFGYPDHALWIALPSIEGGSYAVLLAWYHTSFPSLRGRVADAMSWLGRIAYSMYLWQMLYFALVMHVLRGYLPATPGFTEGTLILVLLFLMLLPLAWLSYLGLERPFFRFRRHDAG